MRRARYVLAACLLLAFWLFPFDCRAGGGEAKSGTGWNDGEMPPVFNPYVEDEAQETDEMRIVLFEGVSRDIPAYVLDGLRRQGGSLDVAIWDYFEARRFDTLFTPTGLLSLCHGKDPEDKIIARISSPEKDPKLWDILKLWACARLPDVFDHFSRARRLDALRLEYLRRMEERRLMAELGVEMEQREESPERDPLYRLGEADAKGYYDGKGEVLQELREMRRHWPARRYQRALHSLVAPVPQLTEDEKRMAARIKEIIRLVTDYWEIPEGTSKDVWPQYVWEKERKMRSMEGEALSSPTHLLFLVETGELLQIYASEEAYRCMSLAWVRQCQAHRELSARIVEILRRSGLREDYARSVRRWKKGDSSPATRLGTFVNPYEVLNEVFSENRDRPFRPQMQVEF